MDQIPSSIPAGDPKGTPARMHGPGMNLGGIALKFYLVADPICIKGSLRDPVYME